jgi:prepilin signal peptidase PulO-like enzyme (type II secretory pathway)
MILPVTISLFIIGLFIGSFLNVVADRLVNGESILWGRSHCDACKHTLGVLDLFPILSFLFLGAKCRYCKKNLSWQYPLSELCTGACYALASSVLIYSSDGYIAIVTLTYALLIISACIVIIFADIRYRIIPDEMVIFVCLVALLYVVLIDPTSLTTRLISACIHFLFFLMLVVVTKGRGMGMGDVKFAFAMGMALGFPYIVIAFYLSFLTGASVSLILMMTGGKRLKSTIAFGPFLAGSTIVVLLYGQKLLEISMRILGI